MRAFLRRPAAPAPGGFLALAAAIGTGRFAWTPTLPCMAEEPGLDRSQGGRVEGAADAKGPHSQSVRHAPRSNV